MTRGRAVAIIATAAALFVLPIVIFGYTTDSHDSKYHVLWTTHFARVLWSGVPYPRWLMDMNGGLGSPVFFYHPPLPYYVAALFDFGSDRVLSGAHQLRFAAPLVLVASAFTFFLFLRDFLSRSAAVMGAVAYAAMPYHLFDLYMRGDYAEFTAFVFVPLVLVGCRLAVRSPLAGTAVTATSFAAAVLSHPLAAGACAPLFAAYAIYLYTQHRSVSGLVAAAVGALLGSALAAAFLLPALTMQKHVVYQLLDIHLEFLFFGAKHAAIRFAQVGLWILCAAELIVFGSVFFMRKTWVASRYRADLAFWSISGLVYCLFLTRLAEPVWAHVHVLGFFQFPFRLNIAVDVALSVCLALLSERLARPWKTAALAGCIVAGMGSAAMPIALHYFNANPGYWAEARRCSGLTLLRPKDGAHWKCGMAVSPLMRDPSAKAWLASPGSAKVVRWQSRSIVLDVDAAETTTLYVGQFAFPGWGAALENGKELNALRTADGILAFSVPPGHNRVEVTLRPGPAEIWGKRISLTAIILLLVMIGVWAFGRRTSPGRVIVGNE